MATQIAEPVNAIAFPKLTDAEMQALEPLAECKQVRDGEYLFHAGDAELDLYVVEKGLIEILNPADENRHIVNHGPGQFVGDIDLLTGRPVNVNGIARGETHLMRVQNHRLREVLSKIPLLGEKLLIAAIERRKLLSQSGVIGIRVVGPGKCKDTMLVREFLFKNFVPFTWSDSDSPRGKEWMQKWGSPKKSPVLQLGNGELLINPNLRELAEGAGVWRHCPSRAVDLVIIGAGPAGMAAAVYAASEGVSTLVLDRLGPGGQVGGSSKVENFMGFPSGLTGEELATRSVLQMLKFGAQMVAPVTVEKIIPSKELGGVHEVKLDCGATIQAKTVLIAAGVRWRKLDAEGADRFEMAGIHYACTSVEAMLYDTQDVAVVGAGNSAGQAAMFLAECCRNRTVHMIIRHRLGPNMSEYLVNRIRSAPNIKLHENTQISAVHGERRMEAITLQHRGERGDEKVNSTSEASPKLPVAAAFVFIGADPGCGWLPESIARDSLGYILTGIDAEKSGKWPLKNREPCPLETTIPGLLAAGDIRSGSTKRVGFAVGDGSLAVTCVHKLAAIGNAAVAS
jgi:thioredoxin reductase (NADPH)